MHRHQAHGIDPLRSGWKLAQVALVAQAQEASNTVHQARDGQPAVCWLCTNKIQELPNRDAARAQADVIRRRKIGRDSGPIQQNRCKCHPRLRIMAEAARTVASARRDINPAAETPGMAAGSDSQAAGGVSVFLRWSRTAATSDRESESDGQHATRTSPIARRSVRIDSSATRSLTSGRQKDSPRTRRGCPVDQGQAPARRASRCRGRVPLGPDTHGPSRACFQWRRQAPRPFRRVDLRYESPGPGRSSRDLPPAARPARPSPFGPRIAKTCQQFRRGTGS